MQENKIETFLTQIKSLDALALSVVEELKLCQLQNGMLKSENSKLDEELRLLRSELSHIQESKETSGLATETSKQKAKKTKSKAVELDAPTLF